MMSETLGLSRGDGKRALIIGHRGFPARFPDNSLAGVQAALKTGADGVEVDVRLCAEGVWVCHHDRSREGRPVSTWSLGELRAAGVPTLAAVVDALPLSAWLFVEVKPLAVRSLLARLDPLLRLLEPRLATTRVLSSSRGVITMCGVALPRLALSWVVNRIPRESLPGVDLSPHHRLVERLGQLGVALHPWTVNRRSRMAELRALGVASITTNHPDRAVEVLRG